MDDPHSSAQQLTQLREENQGLHASLQQSKHELQQSTQKVELLRAQRIEFISDLKQRDHKIVDLQHQVQALLRRYFGRSSEKLNPNQRLLFEDMVDSCIPETPAEEDSEPQASTTKRKGHGRRRLPSTLPREKVIHDLAEAEKPCPCCGQMRHIIGKETHEQLDYTPAKVKVIEHVRLKYGCPRCEAEASPDGPQIVVANKPMLPIEKGLAAPGLLSYVIVSKYGDHLPMHRLEGILQRHGIDIARSTMCDWAAQCADVLSPLTRLMQQRVLQSKVIHTDDTPVKVLDRDRGRTRTGRFWVYLGDADQPYTVFDYTPSRSRDGPMTFLRDWGKDEGVYLQADAFGGYDGIYAGDAGGQVAEVACWAHARRKFYDARESDSAASAQALAYIRLLYDVESEAKRAASKHERTERTRTQNEPKGGDRAACERRAIGCDLASVRYRLRQASSVGRLAEFKTWLASQRAEHGGPVLPQSPMGKAIQYSLNQWDALCIYTTDGRLAIDNNASENALRRVAIGRKNWMFCGSDKGGRTAATLFSVIATCKRHKIDPLWYLRDVLTRIAATPIKQLAELLPDRWQPTAKN